MVPIKKSLPDLLHCKQQTQTDMTLALQAIEQSQRDHANDSLIDDICTFDVKPELNSDWILKFENIAVATTQIPKILTF